MDGRTSATGGARGSRRAGKRRGRREVARPAPPRPLSPPQGAGSAGAGAKEQPPGQKTQAGVGQSPRAPSRAPRDAAQAAPSLGMAGKGYRSRLAPPLLLLALLWPGRAAAAEVSERGAAGRWRGVPQRPQRHLGQSGAQPLGALCQCTAFRRWQVVRRKR